MKLTPLQVVKAYYAAFAQGGVDRAAEYLSDDFKAISNMAPAPLDKSTFVGMLGSLLGAMPDLKWTASDLQVEGNVVKVTEQRVGTHTQPLDLSELSLGVFPPTGRVVTLPPNRLEFTVEGGKITQSRNVTPSSQDSGMAGVLQALGAHPPYE